MKVKNNNITKEHHISTGYVSQKLKLRFWKKEKWSFVWYRNEAKLKKLVGVASSVLKSLVITILYFCAENIG